MRNLLKFSLVMLLFTAVIACSDDDSSPVAQVTINNTVFDNGDDFDGDIDGDFTGDGGSTIRTFVWLNNLTTADYNADITASADGMFNIVVNDADGNTVLDRSLEGTVEPDSLSGVTSAGTSGLWTVTITLTSFNGDGSFSLSEGD